MKAIDTITNLKFDSPNDILNYFEKHKIPFKIDPETKKHIYAINPETRRSLAYEVNETKNGTMYLTKV